MPMRKKNADYVKQKSSEALSWPLQEACSTFRLWEHSNKEVLISRKVPRSNFQTGSRPAGGRARMWAAASFCVTLESVRGATVRVDTVCQANPTHLPSWRAQHTHTNTLLLLSSTIFILFIYFCPFKIPTPFRACFVFIPNYWHPV